MNNDTNKNSGAACAAAPAQVKLDLATWNPTQFLTDFISSITNPVELEVWIRDRLIGTVSMANDLKWARQSASKLREEADAIERRAVTRLVEDIISEWPKESIHAATRHHR